MLNFGTSKPRVRGTRAPGAPLDLCLIITTCKRSCGKVMFLVSVILFTGSCLVLEGCLVYGVPGPGGAWWRPPGTVTAAGGTHPTGMHSCSVKFSCKLHENEENWTGGGAFEICLSRSATTNEFMVIFLLHFCRYYQLLVIKCKQFCI